MSKKNSKSETQGTAEPTAGAAEPQEKRKAGRKPMTDAQKQAAKVSRGLKELAGLEQFSDPALWAALDPIVLSKVEKALVHVRTVIHKQELDALKARLAALETTPAPESN